MSKHDNRCNQRLNGRALEIYQRLKHEPRGTRARVVNRGIELAYDEMQGRSFDVLHEKVDRILALLESKRECLSLDPPGEYIQGYGIPDELQL